MNEDYIRDELQKATAEYIKAVRLAIARTKEAERGAGSGSRARYFGMNRIERFHEDRRMSLEAFLHNLESGHSRGMILSIDEWLERMMCPSKIAFDELTKGLTEDERERIKRELGVAEPGGQGHAGGNEPDDAPG